MDIPIEAPFATSFPLPFRALVLAGTGILGWATNLHGLHLLGIDAAAALEIRPFDPLAHGRPSLRLTSSGPPDAVTLARAVYRLCIAYAFVVFTGWALFRLATSGELNTVDYYKWIPAVTALVVVMLTILPFNVLEKRVRDMFLLAVRRCFFSSTSMPVYFCDIVLADILTSFAKVIGDIWLSFCMIMPGGSLLIFPQQDGWTRLMVPFLLSVPYGVRFRQCIIAHMQTTTTSKKQLYNALKYASAFPMIFLSAAQREIKADSGEGAKLGEHPLFRLWLLSVAFNSLYSFWWDVTNDWGLELLTRSPTSPPQAPKPLLLPILQARRSSLENTSTSMHTRHSSIPRANGSTDSHPSSHSPYAHQQQPNPWGLRPTLLFPLPAYPLAIFANLVLRLTWSLKLSTHLHARVSGALLFFWLELAEVLRRWVWVFFRVEWECVRREMERGWERERGESVPLQIREERRDDGEEYGMDSTVDSIYDGARDKIGHEDILP